MSVDVLNESGVEVDVASLIRLCRFVLRRMRLHPQTEMTMRLVDPPTITTFNERWMDKQGPTDVLSFPMDELTRAGEGVDPSEGESGYLGDIALCPQIAEQQASAAGHDAEDEIALLTVHGILHLMGYDHATAAEHAEMFGVQGRLLLEWREAEAGEDRNT